MSLEQSLQHCMALVLLTRCNLLFFRKKCSSHPFQTDVVRCLSVLALHNSTGLTTRSVLW